MGDIFQRLPIRVFGFGFAISEACRYGFSEKAERFFYKATFVYMAGHMLYTTMTAETVPPVVITVLYEVVCTCILPPLVATILCRYIAEESDDETCDELPERVRKWAPFACGVVALVYLHWYVNPAVDEYITWRVEKAW